MKEKQEGEEKMYKKRNWKELSKVSKIRGDDEKIEDIFVAEE